MMFSGTPSRASSSAWAWRSWCGATRRRPPARAASRRNSLRTAAPDHGRPRGGPSMMQNSGPTRRSRRGLPRLPFPPPPLVHPAPAPPAALAVADQDRSAPVVEVVLGERERLLNAQPGAPEDNDHRSHAPAVAVIGGLAHDRHDLVDRGRVRWVAHALVARWATGVIPGQGR